VNILLVTAALAAPIILSGAIAFRLSLVNRRLRLLLAFSAAYLFTISFIHMLPEAFSHANAKLSGLFIVLGFCLQLVIDTFSAGIEHGHVHLHSDQCHKRLPTGIVVGLLLHSVLEGLPVYDIHSPATGFVNYQIVLGLAIHNLPITLAYATLLREHEESAYRRWVLLLLFAMMAPIGFLASHILHSAGLENYESYGHFAYALVIGIFLHISTAILYETSEQHRYNFRKALAMLTGIVAAYFLS
jgi:zinc and cadmium transporter